jgi:hybrid cluster-associated redox disulfide protein
MTRKSKITKNSIIAEVMLKYPEVMEVMSVDYGLGCVGCMMAGEETIEQGASVHGMSSEKIGKMVSEMNKKISEK